MHPGQTESVVCGLLGNAPEATVAEAEKERLGPETSFIVCGDGAETTIWARQNNTLRDSSAEIGRIRQACWAYSKAAGDQDDDEKLGLLYRRVRHFCSRVGLSGFTKLDSIASALEALLFEIAYKKVQPTPSILRTMAQAVDCLGGLAEAGDTTFDDPLRKPKVLVVDDDAVCMFTTVAALKLARVEAVGTQDPKASLRMLEAGNFNLVILDVDMPELSGFEVCERLRQMPQYKSCPVMFVTIRDSIDDRARGVLAKASDYVLKPITPAELTVKITLLLASTPPAANSAPHNGASSPISVASAGDGLKLEEVQPAARETAAVSGKPGSDGGAGTVSEPAPILRTSNEAGDETHPAATTDATPPQTMAEPTPPVVVESTTDTAQAPAGVPGNGHMVVTEQGLMGSDSGGTTLRAAAPEPQLAPDGSHPQPDTLAKDQKEWDALVARVYSAENELYRERARIKRRDRTIESLQKQLGASAPTLEQREAASAPVGQTDEAQRQAQAQCSQLEQELAAMRQAREELDKKAAQAQAQADELDKRSKDLENRLGQTVAALERSRAGLDKQVKERAQAETDLRRQVEAAGATRQQAQARCSQLEQELATMRQAREELDKKAAQGQAQADELDKRSKELENRLGETVAELERSRAGLEQQVKERAQAETDLRRQLDTAGAAQQQAQARCGQLEQELATMRQAREELDKKAAQGQAQAAELDKRSKELEKRLGETVAELERSRAELEKQAKERAQAEADLGRQLEAAGASRQQAQARCGQLEQELAAIRQSREELNRKTTQGQAQAAELDKRSKELEKRLGDTVTELERSRAEVEKQVKERVQAEADLRRQLEAAGAPREQAQARCTQLEQELAAMRQAREELNGKLARERAQAAESNKHSQELEKCLSDRWVELERAKSELEKQAKGRTQTETDLRRQLEAAGAAQQQAQARCAQLEQELAARGRPVKN